jgi:hypothetical protein
MIASALAIAVAATLMLQGTASARQVRPNHAHAATHTGLRVPHRGYGDSILFYGPSIGTRKISEASIAEAMGFDVTVATKGRWAAMSRPEFKAFGAIVFGDPGCKTSTDRLDVADANANTWSGAIQGHVVVTGTDPVWHANHGVEPGPEHLIVNTLAYVSRGAGTGLAVGLSCYYSGARRNTPVSLLRRFGTFTVQGQGRKPLPGCPDKVETPDPAHALLTGLSADDLSNWGCSIHEAFDSMPDGFAVVAQHRRTDLPYIITGKVGISYP